MKPTKGQEWGSLPWRLSGVGGSRNHHCFKLGRQLESVGVACLLKDTLTFLLIRPCAVPPVLLMAVQLRWYPWGGGREGDLGPRREIGLREKHRLGRSEISCMSTCLGCLYQGHPPQQGPWMALVAEQPGYPQASRLVFASSLNDMQIQFPPHHKSRVVTYT